MNRKTIKALAKSRIRYNKNRTLLTTIAIVFTTMLLMALGTCLTGIIDIERQLAVQEGNYHAVFVNLTGEQMEHLKNHMEVESLDLKETFASIEYGKMTGFLQYHFTIKDGIYYGVGNLIEGHEPTSSDEICGPKAFFEQMDVEPILGNTITISFRPNGDGAIETKTFTICGIISQIDISKLSINNTRLLYGAYISEDLIKEYISQDKRRYQAVIRVLGENELNYDEIKERIESVAEDIALDPNDTSINAEYLVSMTTLGMEMMGIAVGLCTLIVIFSGLVIYSIYYVGVITDVQELGKLKALGASKKQIKQLLLQEGMAVTFLALPLGLIVGYLLPKFLLPVFLNSAAETTVTIGEIEHIHMFSLPATLGVILVVLLTVYISLLKPMRMASRISPIEAIRYQESSIGRKNSRKGHDTINVTRLCIANLVRNRKRTAVTMITMGLSCVLFMSLAALLNSAKPEDIARRNVPFGDFHIALDFSRNDNIYPENNLDSLQQENLFSDELLRQIRGIGGIEDLKTSQTLLVGADFDSELFEDGRRATISPLTREKAEEYRKEIRQGSMNYEQLIEENGVIFTSDYFIDEYGFSIGDIIPMTIYDGPNQISLNVQIHASLDLGDESYFLIPQEIWDNLGLQYNATTDLYIFTDDKAYDSVKEELSHIVEENEHFLLYSMDEELQIGKMDVNMMKYPLYAILIIIAVIGFINLINTMVTSIVTRKKELGVLQAIGLSNRQMVKMLAGEGMFFILGTILLSVTLGNLLGYLIFLWGKDNGFMSVSAYHYPLWETLGLFAVLLIGQLSITLFISRRVQQESLVDRIRSNE